MKFFQLLGGSLLFVAVILMLPGSAGAQRRDYMTDKESDVIREAQEIDQRILVLTKLIDRRFAVLNGTADAKKIQKENEMLGELPPSTPPELLLDINRLLQKSVDEIDNVAEHQRMDSKLFPKAVRQLSESSQKFLPLLRAALDTAATEKDKGVVLSSIEFCNEIIEASAKVPKEVPKEAPKDGKKSSSDKDH